jgi:mono/diheme cytochrome c family protein
MPWKSLAAAFLLLATSAAQAQDVAAGHALAQQICQPCHVIESGAPKPRLLTIGPPFQQIAKTPGMTVMALNAFLATPHPKMPNLILTGREKADLVAYIRSLRHR